MPPDRGKILFGVAVFVVAMVFPFVLRMARGKADPSVPLAEDNRPALAKVSGGTACVEPTAYMRAKHMDLLNTWRDDYVRDAANGRTWRGADGRVHKMSLTGTCLKCHQKAEFCDRCHSFMGETPYCFTCHHESPTAR